MKEMVSKFMVRLFAMAPALAMFVVLALSATTSQAAWDTDITGIVTDATTFFTSIKGLVITVIVFVTAIGFVKLIKKK